jgi:hypothetical protein
LIGSSTTLAALTVCVFTLSTGCASRTAYVVARQNAQYPLSAANKIAIADHAHPREEERVLRQSLLAELNQQGFELVAPDKAEYSLTYWIDESWKRGRMVVSNREGSWADPNLEAGSPLMPAVPPFFGSSGSAFTHGQPRPSIQHVVDVPYATKGIRLKLFDQASMRSGRMQTAWDGYIEGGDRVTERREPVLLRTLLQYFGKDFTGRAKLVQ